LTQKTRRTDVTAIIFTNRGGLVRRSLEISGISSYILSFAFLAGDVNPKIIKNSIMCDRIGVKLHENRNYRKIFRS
jgi:hypothetical protein